ncbi:MAG: insulinase family protein [Phycisphaerales bacterium]|nr:insulinase family protein [Phycisphaerales bacterium]MCB9863167.1 insulinase family protein [Phycisphaerales bacterium]
MKFQAIGLLIGVMGISSVANAQDVKYEKYRLENGMTVILHEDHSLPVACINLWYYVGSKDEAPGRSGFAHLFEHLMFMGTHRVPNGDFDTIMESGGGWNNASTSSDRTNYFSFGPSNLLPRLLWLDADRLEDLGEAMTQEKLDKQREVVRNERRQTSEMQPYGRADLKISELMFPPGHPYHIEVIGTHEDLQAATLQDVKDFFAAYYVPNNAALVVAGDFDPAEIKPLVAKLFGTLQRGADPVHREVESTSLKEVKRVVYTDNVQFARLTLVYHSPAIFAPGDAEMDLVGEILSSGKSSRLYKRLVYEDQLATDVSAYQESSILGSLFRIDITAAEGKSLDDIERVTDEILGELVTAGPTTEELERHKASTEFNMLNGLQSILGKADSLNRYNFFLGEPNSFKRDLERYRGASVASVKNWSQKVLTPNARLIMRVLPDSQKQLLEGRDEEPALGDARRFAPEAPQRFTLSNGIEVRHWQRSELPLVEVSLFLRGGAANLDGARPGLAYLTAEMLDEGAGDLDALEFSDAMDLLGARFDVSAERESTTVNLSVLKHHIDKALSLYADAILRPRFDATEWDRVRALHMQALKQAEDRPTEVASRVGMRQFFGEDHPYGRPVRGTVESVGGLTLEAVKACHDSFFVPANAMIFIAGDLTKDEAQAAMEAHFGAWKTPAGYASVREVETKAPANNALRVVVVDKPGAVQTVVQFYMPGPKHTDPKRVEYDLLNTILGGSFTSRLNQNLREEHGFTYGARSRFAMSQSTGYLVAASNVQAEVTGAALREFLKEFARFSAADISAEETRKTSETNRMTTIQSFQGLDGVIETAEDRELNGLAFSTLGDDLAEMMAASQGDLNTLAKTAIPLDKALLVLVGDKDLILKQLDGLGLPSPIELNVRGEPVGATSHAAPVK